MPTAFVIQHEEPSPPAMIGEAAVARGYELVEFVSVAEHEVTFPNPRDADIIIVTGSGLHWQEVDDYPHLQRELAFIKDAIAAHIPILGLCFGGQGLAIALGGRVEDMGTHEVGWFEIESLNESLIPNGPWFEWHVDHFFPPADAEVLAKNELCVQAFRCGPHLGLQFHPEVNYNTLAPWESLLTDYDGIDPAEVVRLTKEHEPEARLRAYDLFDTFLSLRSGE